MTTTTTTTTITTTTTTCHQCRRRAGLRVRQMCNYPLYYLLKTSRNHSNGFSTLLYKYAYICVRITHFYILYILHLIYIHLHILYTYIKILYSMYYTYIVHFILLYYIQYYLASLEQQSLCTTYVIYTTYILFCIYTFLWSM